MVKDKKKVLSSVHQ